MPGGRKPDACGHQARSEVRSTASRAAVRGPQAPDEVGGPLWVEQWRKDSGRLAC
jgi:hypothetical protein